MSGHSHWAGIKHKKAVQDAKRAQIFTKLGRAITITARLGGGNPDFNPNLRLAIEKAKELNMPKDRIENSIKKGLGELEGNRLEEVQYEGLGPAGIMLIISVITDNKNRTVSEIRRILEDYGGKLANGGISWNFRRAGLIEIFPSIEKREEAIGWAIENGADDVTEKTDGSIVIISNLDNLNNLKEKLSSFNIRESGVSYVPQNPISLSAKQKEQYDKLIETLTDHPDVQEVFDNTSNG